MVTPFSLPLENFKSDSKRSEGVKNFLHQNFCPSDPYHAPNPSTSCETIVLIRVVQRDIKGKGNYPIDRNTYKDEAPSCCCFSTHRAANKLFSKTFFSSVK